MGFPNWHSIGHISQVFVNEFLPVISMFIGRFFNEIQCRRSPRNIDKQLCFSKICTEKGIYCLRVYLNCAHIFIFCLIVLQFGIEDLVLKLLNSFEFHKNQYSQRRHVRM